MNHFIPCDLIVKELSSDMDILHEWTKDHKSKESRISEDLK